MLRHVVQMIEVFKAELDSVRIGAEIGVAKGHTSRALMKRFPDLFLYLVDSYEPERDNKKRPSRSNANTMLDMLERAKPYDGRFKFYHTKSVEGAKQIEDRSLDFAFVDAGHNYIEIVEDIDAWLPKVKVGGIICGDDYGPWFRDRYYAQHNAEVRLAVHQKFRTDVHCGLGLEDRIWWRKVTGNE